MAIKSYDEIKRDIRNKIYSPIYLLQGDEPYYIDQLSDLLEQSVLDEMEKEFNQTVAYGKDIDLVTLAGSAKRYPMMSNYQVVMIKEAQDIKGITGKDKEDEDAKGGKDKDNNPLLNYALQPLSSTVLVLCMKYKSLDKRGKLYKAIEKTELYSNQRNYTMTSFHAGSKYIFQTKSI